MVGPIWGTTNLPGQMMPSNRLVPSVWETLPPHPVVMAEASAYHQQIKALAVADNTMILAYGDWTNNLGPAFVVGYDLDTLQPVTLHGPSPTEAFDRIRIIDGAAYLPWTDPLGSLHMGGFTTNRSGTWEDVDAYPMIHAFDVVKYKGALLVCGSTSAGVPGEGGVGVVARQNPQGQWVEVLRGKYVANLARFYEFVEVDDTLIVQTVDGGLPRETFGTRGGRDWFPIPDAPDYKTSWLDPAPVSLPVAGHGIMALSHAVHDGWLWVAGANGVVKRTRLP